MKLSRPLSVRLPRAGVLFAESAHASDFRMAPRTDPFHKLLYVVRGCIRYAEGSLAPVTVAQGVVLVVPAGIEHWIADEQPSTLFLLCLSRSFLATDPELPVIWGELARRDERRIALSRPARQQIESAWRRALIESVQLRRGGVTTIRALAAQTLVNLVRLPVVRPDHDPLDRVTAVACEMEATFYDQWNLDRAAHRAGTSRRHFTMLFRQACGCTFLEYLNDLRLMHAARLLKSGDHSVTGVIFSCGFGDVSQFYRVFRQRYHLPPGQWAAQARQSGFTPQPREHPNRSRPRIVHRVRA